MPSIGVIAIGRNEGQRLRQCLVSVCGRGMIVVYVDSASTDGSVDLAKSLGAHVVELDMSKPFSAARARNAGVERLVEIDPQVQFLQFVDGDCEIREGWIDRAAAELQNHPEIAVVCGRRRERHPEASIYNRLADIEWDTPPGIVQSCGGDALMRLDAFRAAGGFDPTVVAGEEPELCQRLRRKGWLILRIDAEMTWHDSAITHWSQWRKRQVRSGYGALDIATRFGGGRDGLFMRQIRSARLWTLAWPAAVILGGLAGSLLAGPRGAILLSLQIAAVLPAQMLRLALRIQRRVNNRRIALAYGLLVMLAKWPFIWGQAQYFRDRSAGKNTRLIDYKAAAPEMPKN